MSGVRELAGFLVRAALAAADPARAVRGALALGAEGLRAGEQLVPLEAVGRIVVVGAGKAAGAMALAAEAVLGDRLTCGVVVAPHDGPPAALQRIELLRAAHPIPDEQSARAAQRLLDELDPIGAQDLVLFLLSGGASSLLTLPRQGLSLTEVQAASDVLLRAGVPIASINAVRRHLGQIGGGQLAAAAAPAPLLNLILSDVVGDTLEAIGSGPAVADPTTFVDALAVLERCGAVGEIPAAIVEYLRAGAAGRHPETLKPGDPRLQRVATVIVGSNRLAGEAVVEAARRKGWTSALLTDSLEGEARDVGTVLGALLREVARGTLFPKPCCLVAGGETTVTVRGDGLGGRNQELALAAALKLVDVERAMLVAFATDGVDGPTDAAGGMVDGTTVARGSALGRSASEHLQRNDAYSYLAALDDLLLLGPTGTNVNDLCLLLAW